MNNSVVTIIENFQLQPASQNKNSVSHLKKYNQWCQQTGQNILQPNLEKYRDYLLQQLKPASTRVHLSHVRGAYKQLLQDRDFFYSQVPAEHGKTVSDQRAYVSEWQDRLQIAIDPENVSVKETKIQDTEDSKFIRLTKQQALDYLELFRDDLRNLAIVSLMLATGIRIAELATLEVDDLRQNFGNELSLRVRHGKGDKQRMVPYGGMSWVLTLTDRYLQSAGIKDGYIFPGDSSGHLSVRQISNIVTQKMVISGRERRIRAHDLRRSYSKLCFLAGLPLASIQQNLGHNSTGTTLKYIGTLDAKDRRPLNIIPFVL